jgi:hypothetical protein
MENNRFIVASLPKLVKMFNGGHGTFSFTNTKTGKQFNVRLVKVTSDFNNSQSYVQLCYTHPGNGRGVFMQVGKWDFKTSTFYLKQELAINAHSLQKLLQGWNWIIKHISTGTAFEQNIMVYYDGHCARCGKKLTSLASLTNGFGPECDNYVAKQATILKLFV